MSQSGNHKQSISSNFQSQKNVNVTNSFSFKKKSIINHTTNEINSSIDRNNLKIFSLNVGGFSTKYDLGIIDKVISDFDIICLTETKTDFMENFDLGNYHCFQMQRKNTNIKLGGFHGICILVRGELLKNVEVIGSDTLSDSVLWLKINHHEASFVLGAVYLPHESSKYHDNLMFENLLLDLASLKNLLDLPFLLAGDFNSRTGNLNDSLELSDTERNLFCVDDFVSDMVQESFTKRVNQDKQINKNGRELIELCKVTELKILNGRVGKDEGVGKYTCLTGMGQSAIDYMICSPELMKYVIDFNVEPFDRCTSDSHCALTLTLKSHVELCVPRSSDSTAQRTTDIEPNAYSDNTLTWVKERANDFRNNFDAEKIRKVRETIQSLELNTVNDIKIDLLADSLKSLFVDSTKESNMQRKINQNHRKLTGTRKTDGKPWFNSECYDARKQYLKLKNKLSKENSSAYSNKLREEARRYKNVIYQNKTKYQNELSKTLRDTSKSNPKLYWDIIKGKRREKVTDIVDLSKFKAYFENLNGIDLEDESDNNTRTSSIHADDSLSNEAINGEISIEEISRAIKELKNNKSPGYDGLHNEYLKNCPNSMIELLKEYFNLVLNTGIIPTDWSLGIINPIYKGKGPREDPDNYRGITLLSCIGKVFTSILNSRISLFVEDTEIMRENQVGFRKGYNTLDHIYVLHSVIEFYLRKKEKLYCAFVDYKKAFDMTDRISLWKKLLQSEINGKVLRVIQNIYNKAKSCVRVGNRLSEFFPCRVGVRQGENLSPLLFAIYLNDFESFICERYDGLNDLFHDTNRLLKDADLDVFLKLYCLLYADDTVILAETENDLQKALSALSEYCELWKISVNIDKTKIIIFSRGKIRKHITFKFNRDVVEVVDDYVYLGVTFNYNNSFTKAVTRQLTLGRKAMFAMLSKIHNLNLPVEIQLNLFEKLITPVLLYGCEVWGHANLERLELFHRKFLKNLLRVNKFTSKSIVYCETGTKKLEVKVYFRMISFWGRLSSDRSKKISTMIYNLTKQMHVNGNAEFKWLSHIKSMLDNLGLSYIWRMDGITQQTLRTVKQRLSDEHTQKLYSDVSENPLCVSYRIFKNDANLEEYLYKLNNKERVLITRLRCGSHSFPVSNQRYLPLDERNHCPHCPQEIGDEFHYILSCPHFHDMRIKYIDKVFWERPNVLKFSNLLSSKSKITLVKLSKFIGEVFKAFQI